ncbi:MAG TPA: cell wall-binding repeat-containing protein [Microbacteriaceae bacterium]
MSTSSASAATPGNGSSPAPTTSSGPSLAEMNAAHDHTMGSTIPKPAGTSAQARTLQAQAATTIPPGLPGLDVSAWQEQGTARINWTQVAADGAKFAYVKATEGTYYTSSRFTSQFSGAASVGLIRGAYHFATPNTSSGAAQANYFLSAVYGVGWTPDGKTLPPLLDIEYDPYASTDGTNTCYGLSPAAMVSWITDFSNTILARTGRLPAIYSTTGWWSMCTGNSARFLGSPLFIARYPNNISDGPGTLPAGWSSYAMWQWADSGVFPGDQDVFNGDAAALQTLGAMPPITRVQGTDRYATSAALSATFAAGAPVAYIASGQNYPDALSGAAAAGRDKGPVLLVQSTAIPASISAELKRLKPKKIVVLGGASAISTDVQQQLQAYTTGTVTRLAGDDRYETSAAIASTFTAAPSVAYVATGENFPDALSAASAAAGTSGGPILLVTATSIPAEISTELARLHPGKIDVLGGVDAVSADVQQQLQAYTSGAVTRLSGADRYDTSAAIAQTFASATTVYIAVGTDYPDALSGGPVAGATNSPVLLVQSDAILPSIATQLSRLKPSKIVILGGPSAVSTYVQGQLSTYIN